jgi:hypothetical protein
VYSAADRRVQIAQSREQTPPAPKKVCPIAPSTGIIRLGHDNQKRTECAMPMKPLLVATAFAALLAPALAFAQGCDHGSRQAQISCADGQNWDAKTGTCVTVGS